MALIPRSLYLVRGNPYQSGQTGDFHESKTFIYSKKMSTVLG